LAELEMAWTQRYAELEARCTAEARAGEQLREEKEALQAQLEQQRQESTAMLGVYEGALETALNTLAEEREAAAADNRNIRSEVFQTVEGLSAVAKEVSKLMHHRSTGGSESHLHPS